MALVDELSDLVGWQTGRISPAIYFDEEIYRRERELIFERTWLPVGHEDMVRNPGDYVTNYMGEVPVILTRDRQGSLHVLINKCRHRGNQVCLFDRGNVRAFTCSYHGWSYGIDGTLKSVPLEQEVYHGALEKQHWGLEKATVANFHGLVFATLDPAAPSFENWLTADVRWWLQNLVLAEPIGGLEALPGWHRNQSPANWKLIAENFIGDCYHFAHTHTSLIRIAKTFPEQTSQIVANSVYLPERSTYEVTAGFRAGCPLGLSKICLYSENLFEVELAYARSVGREVVEWVRERNDRMAKALAEYEPRPHGITNGLLFPNLGLMGYKSPLIGRHFLFFHPRGSTAHEVWQATMVEKEAPESVKEIAAEAVYRGQHMAGLVAPDDVENFERMVAASSSPRTWRLPMNYEIHLGHDEDLLPHLPGNCGAQPSEVSQRAFYRFWLDRMNGGCEREEEEG